MLIYIYKNDSIFSCFRIIVSAGFRHQPVNLIIIYHTCLLQLTYILDTVNTRSIKLKTCMIK